MLGKARVTWYGRAVAKARAVELGMRKVKEEGKAGEKVIRDGLEEEAAGGGGRVWRTNMSMPCAAVYPLGVRGWAILKGSTLAEGTIGGELLIPLVEGVATGTGGLCPQG